MSSDIITSLTETAEEFGAIAQKVNDSSKQRKEHSQSAIQSVVKVMGLNEDLIDEIESVAQSNISLRDKDSFVLNNSLILRANISKQKELLEVLSKKSLSSEQTEKFNDAITQLEQNIADAIVNMESIIDSDNEIILHDKILTEMKKNQLKSLKILNQLTEVALEDAERAITGSASNLERGLQLVKRFQNVKELIDNKDTKGLKELEGEAQKGWEIAQKVNESSSTQLAFAEKVNSFVGDFHLDAVKIEDLVKHKHHLFEQNLQTITVLTVITTMKLQKYLPVLEILESVKPDESDSATFKELNVLMEMAASDIRDIGSLNYDNTDIIELNNKVEHNSVELSKEEMELFIQIKDDVQSMTAATAYPIEGSAANIVNGKKLQEMVQKVL